LKGIRVMASPPIERKRAKRGEGKGPLRSKTTAYRIKMEKEKRERYELALRLMKEDPGAVTIGAYDGRVMFRKEVTHPCKRCSNDFSFVMTTRRKYYCDECRAVVAEEKRIREKVRQRNRPKPKPWPKGPRLIRYAGYDKSEKVQEKNYAKSQGTETTSQRDS
jgi:hypothetical protein